MAEQQQLIVDFPTHRNNNRSVVHFSDTSELYIVPRHDDNEEVCRQDLWCNEADYSRMKRAKKSVRKIRQEVSAGVPISYEGGSLDAEDDDDCLIGIEHLLTPDIIQGKDRSTTMHPSGAPRTSKANYESII